MINNLKIIKSLLTFESKDDFYYLQILQRKKENPQLGSNRRVIKNYYINSNIEGHETQLRFGSLTLAHSQNSQMSFMYGFFFVKFLFSTVVCVVIVI